MSFHLFLHAALSRRIAFVSKSQTDESSCYYVVGFTREQTKRAATYTAGGVEVLRANIVTDYGVVHIIDGLMDRHRLMDACPSLRQRLSNAEGQQVQNGLTTSHSISLRKVSDQDFLAGQDEQSIKNNEIDHLFDSGVVVVPFSPDSSDPSQTESKYGMKLLFPKNHVTVDVV